MGICEGNIRNEDDIPDQSYDFLILQEKKKDGLDLYKPKETLFNSFKIKCH